MTTPGWLQGGDSREKSGLAPGAGPYRIITNMAVMDFEPVSKRMRVISVNPGYTFKDVQENCGFELLRATEILETPAPSAKELQILREEVDPYGCIIGRKHKASECVGFAANLKSFWTIWTKSAKKVLTFG